MVMTFADAYAGLFSSLNLMSYGVAFSAAFH